jgi:hypothetical protein
MERLRGLEAIPEPSTKEGVIPSGVERGGGSKKRAGELLLLSQVQINGLRIA